MKHVWYYIKNFTYNAFPAAYFKRNYHRLCQAEANLDQLEIESRFNYYFKINEPFPIPEAAVAIKDFKRTKGTGYYLDLKAFLHYFQADTRFAYHFGDETHINDYPTLFKARQIGDHNANSVLFKLNKRRHFRWVNDKRPFKQKKNKLVWRGSAYHKLRTDFVQQFYDHPLCDVGMTQKPVEDVPWQKNYMSLDEQLQFKFICCPEGNDVATNLKWVMSSNSLCIMPKPTYETWFMEGVLQAGLHYVELESDYSNLEDIIRYYSEHTHEAESIIANANKHTLRFRNKDIEDLLCLKLLERYAELSGQHHARRF